MVNQKHKLYQVPDLPDAMEQVGTKYKFWYWDENGDQLLFKEGRPKTGENWAEVVCAEICNLLKLPHAEYFFARHKEMSGTTSPQFVPEDARLVLGNEVLALSLKGYGADEKYRQSSHTVRAVITVLRNPHIFLPSSWEPVERIRTAADLFLGYLLLDAIVGNTDRHHENWGFINFSANHVELAPTFDHASSLGRELTNEKRQTRLTTKDKRQSLSAYTHKATSALYRTSGDSKPLHPIEAFFEGCKYQYEAKNYWHTELKAFDLKHLHDFISHIPNDFMSEIEKKFSIAIIEENIKRILEGLEGI